MRHAAWLATPAMWAATALCVAACGGGSKSNTATSSPRSTSGAAPSTPTSQAPSAPSGKSAVSTGAVRAALRATDHSPVVGRNWIYTVTATDADGHPLAGTVLTEFVFAGQVVGRETPPTHALRNGRFRDVLQFPARSVGIPLTFQTVVRTRLGSVTLDWPVKVRR